MDKTGALKRLDAIEKEQAELRKIIEAPEKGRWKPEIDEVYWYINSTGNVYRAWYNGFAGKYRYFTGNCYKTEAEVEKTLEILSRAMELIGDWSPDWDDFDKKKWVLRHIHKNGGGWETVIWRNTRCQGLHFPTEQAAQTMIDEFGDDLFLIMGRV